MLTRDVNDISTTLGQARQNRVKIKSALEVWLPTPFRAHPDEKAGVEEE